MPEVMVIEYLDKNSNEWTPIARVFDETAAMICARAIDENSDNLIQVIVQDYEH